MGLFVRVAKTIPFVTYFRLEVCHYIDVIMTTMASQITSLTVVYSIVYSGADQRKHQSSASLPSVRGIHRDRWIPAQRVSNAESVSIWWRHHGHPFMSFTPYHQLCDQYNFIKDRPAICQNVMDPLSCIHIGTGIRSGGNIPAPVPLTTFQV